VDFLVPAILVTTALQFALQAGVGLTDDMRNGALARFRSLPIWTGSVLVARGLSDLARTGVRLAMTLVLAAVLFGFSPAGGVPGVLGALGLALVVGWGLGWVFLALASWLRGAEAMQAAGFLAMFPLMFASSAFVPLDGLTGWLRAVAALNPITYAVDASRALALGHPAWGGALAAVAISLAVAAVAAPVAVAGFGRPE
jgi:ABC-2 type transport system permease protein